MLETMHPANGKDSPMTTPEARPFLRDDLEYSNFSGSMIRVDGVPFAIVSFDRERTMGIVLNADHKPILGWKRTAEGVHVLGKDEAEWSGWDLLLTVRLALIELHANEVRA
jgi:hypothetical protein